MHKTNPETTLPSQLPTPNTPLIAIDAEAVAQWLGQRRLLHELTRAHLVDGSDFVTLPNTSKPSLLKAGAEKILYLHNCSADFTIIACEVDHDRSMSYTSKSGTTLTATGLYRYVVRCDIRHRATGAFVGSGIGAASSVESKYANRPRELENTILKMAAKRAMVDAVVKAFALSDLFSQDLEDLADTDYQPPAGRSEPPPENRKRTRAHKEAEQQEEQKRGSTVHLLRSAELNQEEIEQLATWAVENDAMADVRSVVRSLADSGALNRANLREALAVLGFKMPA